MADVFRAMIAHEGKPKIGNKRDMLGVREDGSDILIADDGAVEPDSGGLSVGPDWRQLPPHTIPRRLKDRCPGARANNNRACFRLDDAEFRDGPINSRLDLKIDSNTHGTIQPLLDMDISDFQDELAATIARWVIDEE